MTTTELVALARRLGLTKDDIADIGCFRGSRASLPDLVDRLLEAVDADWLVAAMEEYAEWKEYDLADAMEYVVRTGRSPHTLRVVTRAKLLHLLALGVVEQEKGGTRFFVRPWCDRRRLRAALRVRRRGVSSYPPSCRWRQNISDP